VVCHPRCWSLSILLLASLFWTEAWNNALPLKHISFALFNLLSGRERKLQNLDEKAMQEIMRSIITEEENDVNAGNKNNGKKKQIDIQKAKNKVQQRLANEKKSKKQEKEDDDEDMSDEDLVKFAKGSRAPASKGKSQKQ